MSNDVTVSLYYKQKEDWRSNLSFPLTHWNLRNMLKSVVICK